MANRHRHFAFGDIPNTPSRSLVKQFEGLLIFLAFWAPHTRPLDPTSRLGIALIATEPIEADAVVARQAPEMVQARQGFPLFPAVICLGLDAQGVCQP